MKLILCSLVLSLALMMKAKDAAPTRTGWDLVWNDEFNGTTLDETKWAYRQLGPRESALISKDSISLDGQGHLLLTVKKQDGKSSTA